MRSKNKIEGVLFIDAGNSCFKVGYYKKSKLQIENYNSINAAIIKGLLKNINIQKFKALMISSVLKKEANDSLSRLFKPFSERIIFAREVCKPLINTLYDYSKLGEDRIVLVAYMILKGKIPGVIIDSGSAVTIDFIKDDKVHAGGYIIPGFDMDFNSLHYNTALLPKHKLPEKIIDEKPVTTDIAIINGVIKTKGLGIKALIEEEPANMGLNSKKICIILTGGSGEILLPFISKARYIPNAVIMGLIGIYKIEAFNPHIS